MADFTQHDVFMVLASYNTCQNFVTFSFTFILEILILLLFLFFFNFQFIIHFHSFTVLVKIMAIINKYKMEVDKKK